MTAYSNAGVAKLLFITGASSIAGFATGAVASGSQLTAALDLSVQLNNLSGMKAKTDFVEAPVLAYKQKGKVASGKTLEDIVLTFFSDDLSDAIKLALADGVKGYLVWLPLGNTAGKRQEVWQVTSAGANEDKSITDLAKFEVAFSSSVPPNEGIIP